jgi:hypothetical protein
LSNGMTSRDDMRYFPGRAGRCGGGRRDTPPRRSLLQLLGRADIVPAAIAGKP